MKRSYWNPSWWLAAIALLAMSSVAAAQTATDAATIARQGNGRGAPPCMACHGTAFIKANMPFSRGGTLTTQQAWDVAMYMDSHERPQDPRFAGSVAQTRKKYHGSKWSLYGKTVNGHVLGSGTSGSSQ